MSAQELEFIGKMLKAAEDEGMLTEVVWSFGNERKSGENTEKACLFALYEWDI